MHYTSVSIFHMMKSFVFLLISVFLFSCSGKQTVNTDKLTVYDSISVSIDYPILSQYIKLVPYSKGDTIYVTGYNYFEHSIDFVNLGNGENFILSLQREGPDGVLPVQDYCFVENKIVCKDESGVVTLAMDGRVLNRLPIKELTEPTDKYSVRPLGFSLSNYMYLNSRENKVFIPLSPIKKADAVHIGKIYDVSLNRLEFFPPCYPPEVIDYTQYLGGLSIPDINMYGIGKIVYNFPFCSQVYLYNMETSQSEVFDIRSSTIYNNIDFEEWKGIDAVEKSKKELYMPRFGRVYYSSTMKKFYRIHFAAKEEGVGKLRKTYLMIFDENANSIQEYLLPSQFSEQYFFLHDTLYFACRNSNDTSLNIARINLSGL